MDPSQRPDRELIAKEIDKLDAGRPVTQYDVLAWMQVSTPARAYALAHTRTHTLSLSLSLSLHKRSTERREVE